MTTCPKCTKAIPSDSQFCPFCGVKCISTAQDPTTIFPVYTRPTLAKKQPDPTITDPVPTKAKQNEPILAPVSGTPETLLKRAFLFLEDGLFSRADQYLEVVLDQDPENAQAYLGKLMIDLEVTTVDQLNNYPFLFDDNKNYVKALRFADEDLAQKLNRYVAHVNERILQEQQKQLQRDYENAIHLKEIAKTSQDYINAANAFSTLGDYEKAVEYANASHKRAELLQKEETYCTALSLSDSTASLEELEQAIDLFHSLGDWEDAEQRARICEKELEQEREKETEEKNREGIKYGCLYTILITVSLTIIAIIAAVSYH